MHPGGDEDDPADDTAFAWVLYSVIALVLILTMVRGVAKLVLNTWVLAEIFVAGKGVKKLISAGLLAIYLPYSGVVWYLVMSSINWAALENFHLPRTLKVSCFKEMYTFTF